MQYFKIKGQPIQRSITGPFNKMEWKMYLQQFFTWSVTSTFLVKIFFNTTIRMKLVSICVCEIMNMASMCGRSVHHTMSQPFSALHRQRVNQHGCTLWSSNLKQRSTSASCWTFVEPLCNACKRKYLHIFQVSGQLAASLEASFNHLATSPLNSHNV